MKIKHVQEDTEDSVGTLTAQVGAPGENAANIFILTETKDNKIIIINKLKVVRSFMKYLSVINAVSKHHKR